VASKTEIRKTKVATWVTTAAAVSKAGAGKPREQVVLSKAVPSSPVWAGPVIQDQATPEAETAEEVATVTAICKAVTVYP